MRGCSFLAARLLWIQPPGKIPECKIPKIPTEIQDYLESAKRGDYPRPAAECPRCGETPPEFKFHDQRFRLFRFIENSEVCVVEGVLVRWKCLLCNRTFTVYPDFVLPRKWYVRSDVLDQSKRYLESSNRSYDGLLWNGTSRTGYSDDPNSFLWPSTVRRWIVWLGSQEEFIQQALDLIRQKCPSTKIFRQVFLISPHKHRSEAQKLILERARKLLGVIEEYEKYFPKYFPHFAPRE